MTHTHLYAERAAHFRPSPVRSVWDIPMTGGMISLASGSPDIHGLPLGELGRAAEALIAERGAETLQYSAGAGIQELRAVIAEILVSQGIEDARPEDLLITSGSQMGLELIAAMFCDPGDVVLAEAPTYVGAIGTFEGLEAEIVHVECDDDGLIPGALERTIEEVRASGRRVKLLYTIPNFTNPSGITLSAERRPEIARICAEAGIGIVEDDPYGLIRFDGDPVAPIRAHDASVMYLGSLSKIFSPGIRIGWVLAPSEVRARLQLASEATTIHASTVSQHLALAYLRDFDWRGLLRTATDRYRERAAAALAALAEHMPEGTTWTRPSGGFFVWVTLPEGVSADELFDTAVEEKVIFIQGSSFFAGGGAGTGERGGERNLRLSYSLQEPEQITEGIARIGRALARHSGPASA